MNDHPRFQNLPTTLATHDPSGPGDPAPDIHSGRRSRAGLYVRGATSSGAIPQSAGTQADPLRGSRAPVALPEKVHAVPPGSIHPNPRNARTHSKLQVRQIAASIERFGFTNPILVDDDGVILAGHGRLEAAKLLGMEHVPVLRLSHLSPAERRAYVLADNKLALNAGWDRDLLAFELQGLIDLDFEVELTGFSPAEIDFALDAAADARPRGEEGLDRIPELAGPAIVQPGDLWVLGRHRLLCGNARSGDDLSRLMDGEQARMVFTDPPYNVPIDGHVQTRRGEGRGKQKGGSQGGSGHILTGQIGGRQIGGRQGTHAESEGAGGKAFGHSLGAVRHREFAEASGEMSREAFTQFLTITLGNAAGRMADGAIAFVCMDWRHMGELLEAGESGATMPAMMQATGWQAHSVRAGLTGLRKSGVTIERSTNRKLGWQHLHRQYGRATFVWQNFRSRGLARNFW